jgi:hypothetical protein
MSCGSLAGFAENCNSKQTLFLRRFLGVDDAADAVAGSVIEVKGIVHLAGVLLHLPHDVGIVVATYLPAAIRVANIGASQVQVS